jgi:hypothetical protein
MSGVPADAATTKKNRVLDLIRFCQMMPDGAGQMELVNYMWLQHGNTERKAIEYVNKLISMGIFRPHGHKLKVDAAGLAAWESVLGLTQPAVMVICTGCAVEYTSKLAHCPECGSVDRKAKQPAEGVLLSV